MYEYFLIALVAIFVNNIVFAQFFGMCPFIGVSKKTSVALGMGLAVTFVITVSSICSYIIYRYLLVPYSIEFMQTIVFILVIASLVQMIEMIIKVTSPMLYNALGIFLPLITTNCAVLAVALLVIKKDFNLLQTAVFAAASALGFTLAITLFASIRERLELTDVPDFMKGAPIAFITAGLMAMVFMAFK